MVDASSLKPRQLSSDIPCEPVDDFATETRQRTFPPANAVHNGTVTDQLVS
jgi:hypothetical protein